MARIDPTTMHDDDIESEIEHLELYMDECAEIGQGISTKDTMRLRQLRAEATARITARSGGAFPMAA